MTTIKIGSLECDKLLQGISEDFSKREEIAYHLRDEEGEQRIMQEGYRLRTTYRLISENVWDSDEKSAA